MTTTSLPPGLLVRGGRDDLARTFPALVPLQPVQRVAEGVVCAPRAEPESAAEALERYPLPVERLQEVPAWPATPARMAGGWYVRTPSHIEAIGPTPTLTLGRGEAFGSSEHESTALALAALGELPDGAAMDVGCGAGLLALAWAALGKGPATGIDVDRAAVAQALASARHSRAREHVDFLHAEIGQLSAPMLSDRVILANLPAPGHDALLEHDVRPRAILVSGVGRTHARRICREWRARGLRPRTAARRGRWELWLLRGE